MTLPATGISSTISAGQTIGGDLKVVGNVTSNTGMTVNGFSVLTTQALANLTAQTESIVSQAISTINASFVANANSSQTGTTIVSTGPLRTGTFYATANAGDTQYVLTTNPNGISANSFVSAYRNGLVEVPTLHYSVSGNVLTFVAASRAGDLVYAVWNY